MTGRRTILVLCLLCALAFSALAVQSASALTKGTTLFTCKKSVDGTGGKFHAAHCKDADTGSTGEWRHVAIAENTTTELTGTTENTEGKATSSFLESVQAGVVEQLESKLAHILPEVKGVKSWVTNVKDPTGEHYFHGEAWIQFTEVSVTKPPGKGCVVKGGQITTKLLKFTTKGQGHEVKFEPAVGGEPLAAFEIEKCTIVALNGFYEAKGSMKAEADGATLIFTHANVTAQGTLSLRGQKAGLTSTATLKGTDKSAGDTEDTPLSPTTVETP